MPLPGGPADKFGNSFEGRWTVWQMIDLMAERADSIRLEPPGDEGQGIEFWVRRGSDREYHQIKRRERLRAEIMKLGIALFVALVALIGGAQDQLAKLDVLQGLLAVFVMGFGSNVVKDLITQKSQPVKETP